MNLVTISHLVHEGGSKDYTIVTLHVKGEKGGIIMSRNGRLGTVGQLRQKQFTEDADALMRKELMKRDKRGYKQVRKLYDYGTIESVHTHWADHIWYSRYATEIEDWLKGNLDTPSEQDRTAYENADIERGEVWGSW